MLHAKDPAAQYNAAGHILLHNDIYTLCGSTVYQFGCRESQQMSSAGPGRSRSIVHSTPVSYPTAHDPHGIHCPMIATGTPQLTNPSLVSVVSRPLSEDTYASRRIVTLKQHLISRYCSAVAPACPVSDEAASLRLDVPPVKGCGKDRSGFGGPDVEDLVVGGRGATGKRGGVWRVRDSGIFRVQEVYRAL